MRGHTETFSILETEVDGYPLIALINIELCNYEEKTALPWLLSISTPFAVEDNGLPTTDDADALNAWEDAIRKQLNAVKFVFVGRTTWNGNRELLFYVATPDVAARKLEDLIDSTSTRAFAFRCERDEDWEGLDVYCGVR